MRRTNRIVPTYTGDVSGACSALFELGGMVVIHDPSGCNSTYNTHDETRWYDHDSLIFITGFVERDAILGRDDKLICEVVEAAQELRPRFIALCNSPVPFISGTDFRAIAKTIERTCGIPCFYVQTNGMHDYVIGAGNAFVALSKRFVEKRPRRSGTLNILGATPLDLGIAGSDVPLRAFAKQAGFEVVSCWAMGSTLDEVARSAEAEVNLVISAAGLVVARYLREHFGIPYVVGLPIGVDVASSQPANPWLTSLAQALEESVKADSCLWPCLMRRGEALALLDKDCVRSAALHDVSAVCRISAHGQHDSLLRETSASVRTSPSAHGSFAALPQEANRCCLVGEPVAMGSLAAAMSLGGFSGSTSVICPLEASHELLAEGDLLVEGEEGIEEALSEAASQPDSSLYVIADELYRPILPSGAELLLVSTPVGRAPLAHQALSGRNGWKSAVDLTMLDVRDFGTVP